MVNSVVSKLVKIVSKVNDVVVRVNVKIRVLRGLIFLDGIGC